MNTIQDQTSETTRHDGKLLASFSLLFDIGEIFTRWLTGRGGGCKKHRAALQIVTRCFKFLRFSCKDEEELTFYVVDFVFSKFVVQVYRLLKRRMQARTIRSPSNYMFTHGLSSKIS